jgi:hypothetical protein
MEQLELRLANPREVDVDNMVSKGVRFIGKAIEMWDGTWRALADVDGCLCRVELKVTFK